MMASTFELAIDWLAGVEGGFSADPDDPGNWAGGELRGTRYGISAARYPELDIASLSLDDAKAIYRRDYWNRYRCGELPAPLGVALFDAVVQHSPRQAIRMLQDAVGTATDGLLGPATLSAARGSNRHLAARRFLRNRLGYYHRIMVRRAALQKYMRGWFDRVLRLEAFLIHHQLMEARYD